MRLRAFRDYLRRLSWCFFVAKFLQLLQIVNEEFIFIIEIC